MIHISSFISRANTALIMLVIAFAVGQGYIEPGSGGACQRCSVDRVAGERDSVS